MTQDNRQAAACYRKAAEQGYADAQFNLGVAYAYGEGVRQDYARAAVWLRKAAEQGHAEAQRSLGWLYSEGEGVKRSHAEACFWLDLSATGLDRTQQEQVVKERDHAASQLKPTELSRARQRVKRWLAEHPSQAIEE